MSSVILNKLENMTLEGRFKEAFRCAFGDEPLEHTALRFGYTSYQGLDHVLKERRKLDHTFLQSVAEQTGYSIHWLLTEEGPRTVAELKRAAGEIVEQPEIDLEQVRREAVRDFLIERLSECTRIEFDSLQKENIPVKKEKSA